MNKVFHQTKQAFLFSLVFYIGSIGLFLFKVSFAPILLSISLVISMIWVIMVLLEIMRSNRVTPSERMLLSVFIIACNILAGNVYFYFLRERVIDYREIKK